jgi:two-component system chemotaxis response regulator CheB
MKFDPSLYLKWIDGEHSPESDFQCKLINHCVLAVQDDRRRILGFTVFEVRDLGLKIAERVAKRRERPEFADKKFVLYAPDFLKYRAEKLFEHTSVELRFTSFLHITANQNHFHFRDRIRIASVDDSPVLLTFLSRTFKDFGFVDLVATIADSLTAEEKIRQLKPDVITMDIQMPNKNGVQVVRDLLAKEYFPVIMISSLNIEEGSLVFEALNAGAFDYIQKPELSQREAFQEELKSKILISAEASENKAKPVLPQRKRATTAALDYPKDLVWCIGSSTGGTQALTHIFTSLPEHVPPTLVVQHIPAEFSRAFAQSLNNLVPFTVKEAEDGEPLQADHVYIAPGGLQMGVEKKVGRLHICVREAPPVNRFKPSVDYLFLELQKIRGFRLVAGILTGMGRDGAEGILQLKKSGARTLAQDEKTCAVFGMPRAAIELGAIDRVVALDDFAQALLAESLALTKAG